MDVFRTTGRGQGGDEGAGAGTAGGNQGATGRPSRAHVNAEPVRPPPFFRKALLKLHFLLHVIFKCVYGGTSHVPLFALPDLCCGPYREHERTVCEQLDADIEGSGNSWERVVKMVDLQQVHRALGSARPPRE